MRKSILIYSFVLVFLNVFLLCAREVDKEKLKDFVNMDLEFVNYKGHYDSMDTYEQIVGIGEFLSGPLSNDTSSSNYYGKYFINRFIDDKDEKSSVDVFIISDKSALDSILNLRRILTGYLVKSFNYERSSAELIAKVVTIYNAVYRGDLDYYKNSYIEASVKSLTKENAGLSRVYSQWPGKTKIFIPLKKNVLSGSIESDVYFGRSDVDLDNLVTDRVVSSLLKENEGETDFVRDITDVQYEIHQADQGKIDNELNSIHEIDDDITKTVDTLREQLERATDELQKKELEKEVKYKEKQKDELGKKSTDLRKVQQKLDSAGEKLDFQRKVVKEKIQENIDKTNKDKNLPKPGDINSQKIDEDLQEQERLEDLQSQFEKTSDENEKQVIQNSIENNKKESELLSQKYSKPKEISQETNKLSGEDALQLKLNNDRSFKRESEDQKVSKENENLDNKNDLDKLDNKDPLKRDNLKSFSDIDKPDDKLYDHFNKNKDELSLEQKLNNNIDEKESSVQEAIDSEILRPQGQSQSFSLEKSPLSSKADFGKIVFLEVLDPDTNLGVLHLIDSNSGARLKKGVHHGIYRYGICEQENDFIVVVKMDEGKAKLQILNKLEGLKVKSESPFEVSKNSSLYADSKKILVVVKDNNVWKLAKFSPKDLNEFIISKITVLPYTSFSVVKDYIYLQDEFKNVVVLDLNNLRKIH